MSGFFDPPAAGWPLRCMQPGLDLLEDLDALALEGLGQVRQLLLVTPMGMWRSIWACPLIGSVQ